MVRCKISKVEPGCFLSNDINDLNGKTIGKEGMVLTEDRIDYIKSCLGNDLLICVESYDELKQKITNDGVVASKFINLILLQLSSYMTVSFKNGKSILDIANQLSRYLIKHRDILQELIMVKSVHNYTYNHCLNVAIIACQIGVVLKLTESELNALVLGALLHDLGKVDIPSEILDKPSKLSDEEFYTIKKHPQFGCDLLNGIDIDYRSYDIVIQHHEKLDGSGYPYNLRKNKIDDLSRIVAVADIFDALTSERAYHKPLPIHKAMMFLIDDADNGKLDNEVVYALFNNIVIYPVNTYLRLTNGLSGFVVDSGVDNKPVIFDIQHKRFFNLAKHLDVSIIV